MPHPNISANFGILLSGLINHIAKIFTPIHAVVHLVQIDRVEQCAAAILAQMAVEKDLRLPFNQHVPDVENDGLNHEYSASAWKVTWSSMKVDTKK